MSPTNEEKLTLTSMRWPRRRFVTALAMALSLAVGVLLDHVVMFNGVSAETRADVQLMVQVRNLIDRYYVDRSAIHHQEMTYAAIGAMVETLGDSNHTAFLSRRQAKRAGAAVDGKYVGIGIEIETRDRQPVVIAPIDGSPAQRAGVRPGDVILEVNNQNVIGLSLAQISSRIAGEAGEPVELTVKNPRDKRPRTVNIARAAIKLNNVSWQMLPGTDVAHVRISVFSDGETEDLRRALEELKRHGAKSIILDMRNNPGGILDEAIGTASQFMSSGIVLWERNSKGELKSVPVQSGGAATNLPVVVLVNGASASDAEIVAGALHDGRHAPLIGERTFGTGTVLSQFELADGSALLLAVEEWLTPNKHSFWHKGIEPDVIVPMSVDVAPLLPAAERTMTAADLRASDDVQLLRALAWLSRQEAKR